MACFLTPLSLGVVLWAVQKTKKGKAWAEKWGISWLNTLIFGGSLLLAFEHIAHGEIVPWPPFLTAMASPADTAVMLHEMVIYGGAMSIVLVATWGVIYVVMTRVLDLDPKKLPFNGLTRKTE